jgi:glycosyltransferase involved in cell wall biosynthesis
MSERVVICRSNSIAPDPRVEKIARALKNAGFEVTLLGWDRTGQWTSPKQDDGIRYQWIPIRAGLARGIGNLPALLRWQIGLFTWMLRHRNGFDLIHACDLDTVLPALLCKRLFKKKLIYDIFDFYADMLRATPAPLPQLIRWLDLWVIGQADAVILADDSRTEQIAGSHPKILKVIYNSPEDQAVVPYQENLSSSFHLAYIGLLQRERGLFELMQVLSRHPEWRLDLAGFGSEAGQLEQMAAEMSNVRFHGRVVYKKALQLNAQADVLVATYDPAIPNHRYSSPNKVFEAMLLSKPIIVARDTNMDRIITEAGCGVVIPYGDTQALEATLVHLKENPEERRTLGQNARRAYENQYAWENMARDLRELYVSEL